MPHPGWRGLPLNVQSLILSFLSPPLRPAAGPRRVSRFSSTVSLLAGAHSHAATTPTPRRSPLLELESVFEPESDEYQKVPLSKLDQHRPLATPRSPDDSLLSLLAARSYPEAHKLLAELGASGQTIHPRYGFAREAERALWSAAPATRADPDWIEWWELAPGVTDSVHADVHNLRVEDAEMARRATRVVNRLFQSAAVAAAETESVGGNNLDSTALIERFAHALCRQGHTRVVAEHVLVRLATFAPPPVSERIWAAALSRHAAEHETPFRVSGAPYLASKTRAVRVAERRVGVAERERRAARRVQARTESTLLWYLNRQHEAYRSLVRARGRMVLALANLGRHDLAVTCVEQSSGAAAVGAATAAARIKLPNETYLALLRSLAAADAFPLFERTLEVLRAHRRRLVRVPASHRAGSRMPYFVRSADSFLHEPEPTATEAFSTFRYQHVVSTIEEGSDTNALFELSDETGAPSPLATAAATANESTFVADATAERAATRTGRRRSRELVSLVSEGRLADATHLVGGVLLGGPLPSANALATYLDAARAEASEAARVGAALYVLERQAARRSERRAWWSTAEMLSAVRREQPREALVAYKQTFAIAALTKSARRAVWLATRRVAARPKKPPHGAGRDGDAGPQDLLVPSPYAVSVLMQALVPHLRAVAERDERHTRPEALDHANRLVDDIYAELLAADELMLWSSATSTTASPGGGEHVVEPGSSASRLDPYTFVPFLQDRLATHAPAILLLQILADMSRLGIQPHAPHYAIVLHAFAKQGGKVQPGSRVKAQRAATADLDHVLALFERGTSPAEDRSRGSSSGRKSLFDSARASPTVLSLTTSDDRRPLLLPTEPLSLHAYTGVLRGLRERGASGVAGEIMARLARTRSGELVRWIEEDARFREEVIWLKREGCL
ncbi:hypothetical protein JCM3774_005430 [Rhodotorula dairenensis]